jgi:hypothetical protein
MIIKVDDREYFGVDCKNWRLNNLEPECLLKLDTNYCNSCPSKISRNGNYMNPPIFVMTVKETDKNANLITEKTKEPTFKEKAKAYIKAESSQVISGKVSQEVFEKRKEICMSCEHRIEKHKTYRDSIGWCKGGCGCSLGNQRAALSQKLYMPTLSCPKGKFGPEKGEGFNVSDAVDSVKGIVTSVKNLFEKDK